MGVDFAGGVLVSLAALGEFGARLLQTFRDGSLSLVSFLSPLAIELYLRAAFGQVAIHLLPLGGKTRNRVLY